MERRSEIQGHTTLWLERIVWNAAAGAVLAIMVLILLGSLRWLDTVAPATVGARPAVSAPAAAEAAPGKATPSEIDESIPVVGVNRPSG